MRINTADKIYVAGHKGMVGSALYRLLNKKGFKNLITRTRAHLDLCDQNKVMEFFEGQRPDIVIMAAARVGGIEANMKYPAEFLYENLVMQNNIINSAFENGVKKFCFLGSSCIYPRQCPQPIKEEYLLAGPLEPTNEGYALAKIAGLKLVEYYRRQYGFNGISLMPCNLYGTNDCFDANTSHVVAAMVKKFVDAVDDNNKTVLNWGTGNTRRELMHVDDAAEAIIYMIENYDSSEFINIGWGEDITIRQLAEMIARQSGFKGKIEWDTSRPEGMPRKCMDVSRMKQAGFEPRISLSEGIERTISEYRRYKGKA